MKLLILYGPPAAGKLTIANHLASRTGFKVFHNHLSIDCVKPIFEFGSPPFGRLVDLIRRETIAEAARERVDLIFTFVYASGLDDELFERTISTAEENGGEAYLVNLTCRPDEIRQRIGADSRVAMGKLASPDTFDQWLERYEMYSSYPGRESLMIDTAETSPRDAAERIIRHFNLGIPVHN